MKNIFNSKFILFLFLLLSLNSNSQIKSELKVYFDFDKSEISQNSKSTLDSLVTVLNNYNKYLLEIEGYTDSKGSQEYNQNLAKLRADEVFKYLKDKQINSDYFSYVGAGKNNNNLNPNENKQRNTTIRIILNDFDKMFQEKSYYGKNGTIVTANIKTGSEINIEVNEVFTSRSMIENEMYAIDTEGNILESAGMIEIFTDKNISKNIDGEINVKIPIQKGAVFDEEMSIWEEELDSKGKRAWKETKIKPKLDKTGKYYEFNVPSNNRSGGSGSSRRGYNLDKRPSMVGKINFRTEPIYISIYKEFKFTDVSLTGLKFSAKINDSLYAFIKPINVDAKKLQFNGFFENNLKDNYLVFEAKISDCVFSRFKKKLKQYTVCETCYYKFEGKEYNKVVEENKKGFFEWLKRIFNKKKK